MNNFKTQVKPSVFKYIGVWILCGIISGILQSILDLIIGSKVSGPEDLNSYFIVGAIVTIPIISGTYILIYNFFSSLNVKKVMPYIYIVGGLGTLVNFSKVTPLYAPLGVDLTTLYVSYSLAFVISVYIIRTYYINNSERWY